MIDNLVAHIGAVELGRRKNPTETNPLFSASVAVGQACVALTRKRVTRRDYPIIMGPPRKHLQLVQKDKKISAQQKREARLLELGALMIEKRNFPTEVKRAQKRLNYETALHLGHTMLELKKLHGPDDERRRGNINGRLAELTAVSLINYGKSSNHAGIFAPPHHDLMRNTGSNQDSIFYRSSGGEALTQALQIKLRCGGFCNDTKPTPDDREKYHPDIALISGHCDLGLKVNPETRRIDFTIPQLLLKNELDPGSLWSGEHRKLRDYNEALVETIVEEGRTSRSGLNTSRQWSPDR